MILVCGSKKYNNLIIDDLVDSFDGIIRCNMLMPNNGYGKKKSTIQILNCHVYKNFYKKKISLENCYSEYSTIATKEHMKNFYIHIHDETLSIKYIYLLDNNTSKMKNILKRINSNIMIDKQIRCGMGAISMVIIDKKEIPFIIGFSLHKENSHVYSKCTISSVWHNANIEINILKELHYKNIIDATFCLMEDTELPQLNCAELKPSPISILKILQHYGICILKNYYSNVILDNIIKDFHNIFDTQKNKVEILDKENCSNDKRIFHAELYSSYIKKSFSDNSLFNVVAQNYTRRVFNKKTLINKVTYEEGKVKNSGAGWHRDNHDCQFKTIMYLSDVTEKNGNFQFITNSSKKHIGYPPPRTQDYNTRFHDETIDTLLENNKNCKLHNLVGKKGTVILVDTTYIHRGKIIEEGERYAMTEYFF